MTELKNALLIIVILVTLSLIQSNHELRKKLEQSGAAVAAERDEIADLSRKADAAKRACDALK